MRSRAVRSALQALLAMVLITSPSCASAAPAPISALATPRPVVHYPRRMLDLRIQGNGSPLLRADGSLDSLACDAAARYDIVVADAAPMRTRPDIPAALVRRNPNLLLIAYLPGGVWNNPHPGLGDTLTDLAYSRWRLLRDRGALLYGTAGGLFSFDDNVDRANHRAMLALADLDATALVPGVAGLFLDTTCPTIWWKQTPADSIDYQGAGRSCFSDWDRAYREGHRIYVERLRERAGAKLLIGNCGPSGERDVLNGWMREGFPYQNGGTWATNMVAFGLDPGYLNDCELYRQPSLMMLSSVVTGDSLVDRRRFLYGLASATLGGGAYEQIGRDQRLSAFPWQPEYDVDLGVPLSSAFRSGSSTWRREFSRGYVEVNTVTETGKVVIR